MEKELFKDMYYFELDRKEKLNSKVNLPITITILICGAIVYFSKSINMFGIDLISILFWFFYAGLLISTIITVYYICKSFYDYPYEYIPTASDFENDINNLQEYYEDPYFDDIEKDKKQELLQNDINKLIADNYKKCIDKNIISNDLKTEYLLRSSAGIIVTIIALILCSIPFFLKLNEYSDIHLVEIENIKKGSITMCKEEPKKSPPPKPKPTPTRQLHEGVIGKVVPPKPVDTPKPVNTDSKNTE